MQIEKTLPENSSFQLRGLHERYSSTFDIDNVLFTWALTLASTIFSDIDAGIDNILGSTFFSGFLQSSGGNYLQVSSIATSDLKQLLS